MFKGAEGLEWQDGGNGWQRLSEKMRSFKKRSEGLKKKVDPAHPAQNRNEAGQVEGDSVQNRNLKGSE